MEEEFEVVKIQLPTMHKLIPADAIVKIPKYRHKLEDDIFGVVKGVAKYGPIWHYIVEMNHIRYDLDFFGKTSLIIIAGTELENINGSHWRNF